MMKKSTYQMLPIVALLVVVGCAPGQGEKDEEMPQTQPPSKEQTSWKQLTPEEERVIVHKGTETPFSGKYEHFYEKGTYTCKRCGAPLYRSESKFDAFCGWPSFEDEIPGAVLRRPDPDGERTEITCAACGAHLGHVFTGEGFTPKNTRHCVNSISMTFVPEEATQKTPEPAAAKTAKAIFAGGCFWGVEYHFQQVPGVLSTRVGYTGGRTENPTYKQVCQGDTGHTEAIEVTYDPTQTTYENLAKLFFEIHDPTQVNRQGPDVGAQYRSAVFYLDDQQKATTKNLIAQLRDKGYDVATQVLPAGPFWPAEHYHQRYYEKKNATPYCHVYTKRF